MTTAMKKDKKQTICVGLGVQLTRLLVLLLEQYSFQDRQVPLKERTTEWSCRASFRCVMKIFY